MLTFEMLVGEPPFHAEDPVVITQLILMNRPDFPTFMSKAACNFISRFLVTNPNLRLGTQKNKSEVTGHDFFSGLSWNALARMDEAAPHIPTVAGPTDSSNFVVDAELEAETHARNLDLLRARAVDTSGDDSFPGL